MKQKILKIGVTGSAGSGKSLVCDAFRRLGLEVLDCDEIAREVVEPGGEAYTKVVDVFGRGVISTDLSLDRARLRKMIVEKPELRKQLESILHPVIIAEMARQMDDASYLDEPACAVEVPLLFELEMAGYFDTVVVVTAPDSHLADRITARDGVSRDSAEKMLALQMAQDEKINRADHVIYNNRDKELLFQSVSLLYEKLKKSA